MANKRILPYRESVRLQDRDYSKGIYVVTICTKNRECFFGDVINRKMELNDMGKKARELWTEIPNKFENIKLDAFVLMPNQVIKDKKELNKKRKYIWDNPWKWESDELNPRN